MGCGAALYFDSGTDAAIRGLWQRIEDAGLPSRMLELNYPPHMSILLCEDTDLNGLSQKLPEFVAMHPPLPVSFHSLGVFAGEDGVIYLAPTVDRTLLDFHAELWKLMEPYTVHSQDYYRPGTWVPHVTLNLNVPLNQLGEVMEVLQRAEYPLHGMVKELFIADFQDYQTGFREQFKARLGSYL